MRRFLNFAALYPRSIPLVSIGHHGIGTDPGAMFPLDLATGSRSSRCFAVGSAFLERATAARTLACGTTEAMITNNDGIAIQIMADKIVEPEIATIFIAQW